MDKTKSYCISKHLVVEAFKRVKANEGAPGMDGQTIEQFEMDLKNNLYKLWNRMSSGSYMPPPVKRVEIPKSDGRMRLLGIPTTSDRVAQMVVKLTLEPEWDKLFHEDSYGYRPNKSALQAVGSARERCWKYNWVVDLDIKGFFDNIDHELMMVAVRKHTQEVWVLLYVERWLKASVIHADGTLEERGKGTPQGGVISPLLANLFLHYVFDKWMVRNRPGIPFERYADDAVCHCRTKKEAEAFLIELKQRFEACKLELHPEKTKVVYCQDGKRKGEAEHTSFDFLGFTFMARMARTYRGDFFVNFSPAASGKACKAMRQQLLEMGIVRWTALSIEEVARKVNPVVQGWINYYGQYRKTGLHPVLHYLELLLIDWVMRKYKQFKGRQRQASQWLGRVAKREPKMFSHWAFGVRPTTG